MMESLQKNEPVCFLPFFKYSLIRNKEFEILKTLDEGKVAALFASWSLHGYGYPHPQLTITKIQLWTSGGGFICKAAHSKCTWLGRGGKLQGVGAKMLY